MTVAAATGVHSAYYEEEQLTLITTEPQMQAVVPELNLNYVERGICADASYSVVGMRCCKCARKVRATLMDIPGVEGVQVHLKEKRVDVFFQQRDTILVAVATALNSLNFKLALMNCSTLGLFIHKCSFFTEFISNQPPIAVSCGLDSLEGPQICGQNSCSKLLIHISSRGY